MQKVITVTAHLRVIESAKEDTNYVEKEYTELNKYLEQGYKVIQAIPITVSSTSTATYSITFILDK
ncbi:hypothetical protein CMU89_00320 [Elizabethkingia anophelis]|uniref:hypothetical protein n=1 Tax=Elizabethkingia anophelis TaxID=1117645 RepID=UPI000994E585|nr:hypothetical protein [Elizabethkingia anophelis]AQW94779.1 hypothetical protein BBD30_11625 [Elizabethkingia anophelis]MCL1690446.1 hypothetical protein [Elizabethkingia anophelis]MDV3508480.1 hypothetical protein [Elizabethkingia anophelis]MDV3541118.1 hypothetical protein [Elizabethkingia anophelis]MDV4009972.1 hypothetical protein [Elizabethkingia anophelis]